MRAKLFAVLLLALAAAVGVALFLTDRTPGTPEQDPAPVVDGAASGQRTGDVRPALPPPDPERPPGATQRTEQVGGTEVDHSGTLVVRGRVTRAGSGDPVVDAEVELLYPEDQEQIASASTGVDGRYQLEVEDGIPPRIQFKCWAEEHAVTVTEPRAVPADQRVLQADFELLPAYTVEGRVISAATGLPLEGVTVEVRCTDAMFEEQWIDAETDANGMYATDPIEDLPRSGIDVVAEPEDHAPMVKAGLSLRPGESVLRVDFTVWESLTVRGRVLDAGGVGIADATVTVDSTDPDYAGDGSEEFTEDDGSFVADLQDLLPFHGLFILVSAEGHAAVRIQPPQPSADGIIDVGAIRLGPAVRLIGVVRNGRDGTPVPGGDVYAYAVGAPDAEDTDYSDEATIDGGRFELELNYAAPSDLELFIEADGFRSARQRLQVQQGALEHHVQVDLDPVVVLRGVIRRKADNSAVPGAMVRILTPEGEGGGEGGRSRVDGSYRAELPSGDLSRCSVVIESSGQRFVQGALENPPAGRSELNRDYWIDLPPPRRR